MIVDTSFLIDIMRKEPAAVAALDRLLRSGEPIVAAAPTIFELYSGISRSKRPQEEKEKVLNALSGLIMWPLDAEAAERGGRVDGELISSGAKIDPIDSMIAGIALSRNSPIISRNARHFSLVKGLKVEKY